jgi:hypothetical protein
VSCRMNVITVRGSCPEGAGGSSGSAGEPGSAGESGSAGSP